MEGETRLLVVDKETDEFLRSLRLTCTEEMAHTGIVVKPEALPVKSPTSDNGKVWKPPMETGSRSKKRHKHSTSSESGKKVSWQQQGAPGEHWPAGDFWDYPGLGRKWEHIS